MKQRDHVVIRRQLVGRAMRSLREHCDFSQNDLARAIGEKTDANAVSRWERGKIMPQQGVCKDLAKIASRSGRPDLAAIFRAPEDDWRSIMWENMPEEAHLITKLQIALINHNQYDDEGNESPEHRALCELTDRMFDMVVEQHQNNIAPTLFDHFQRMVWLEELHRRGLSSEGEFTEADRKRAQKAWKKGKERVGRGEPLLSFKGVDGSEGIFDGQEQAR